MRYSIDYNHLKVMRGARDMLKEAAKQFRLNEDPGHADMCEMHRRELQKAIDSDYRHQSMIADTEF